MVKDEIFVTGSDFYSFGKVCSTLLKRESPLIEAVSIGKLDCMGETVAVGDFCKKIFKDNPEYARALVDKEQKKVKCVKARRVVLSYACSGQDGVCADKEIGCYKLGEKLASNLRIVHSSLIPNNGSHKLNCYFSSLSDKEVLKPRF